jgi:uncharacterized protein
VSHYFLDSSALIKSYISEQGTAWIHAITVPSASNTIVAPVTQIEVISGIARRKREGTISARNAQAVRLLLDRYAKREYDMLQLTDSLIQGAEDLLDLPDCIPIVFIFIVLSPFYVVPLNMPLVFSWLFLSLFMTES